MSLEKEVAYLVAKNVGWFNGWYASEEAFNKSCLKAARAAIRKVRAYENKRRLMKLDWRKPKRK